MKRDIFEGINDEKFKAHHAKNPDIYAKFKELTILTQSKGFKQYSAAGIRELIRWHTGIGGNDPYKISNNFTPLYARMLMNEMPSLRGFFVTRATKVK